MMKAIAHFEASINQGIHGSIVFSEENHLVKVTISLTGFAPKQEHAIHIHEFGDLSRGCKSTGKHFNPTNTEHGSIYYTETRHAGDMINNITSDQHGNVLMHYEDDMISLEPSSPNCIIGRSVVIHRYHDDNGLCGLFVGKEFRSYDTMTLSQLHNICVERGYITSNSRLARRTLLQKLNQESLSTGNAGGRMACAVIGLMSSV